MFSASLSTFTATVESLFCPKTSQHSLLLKESQPADRRYTIRLAISSVSVSSRLYGGPLNYSSLPVDCKKVGGKRYYLTLCILSDQCYVLLQTLPLMADFLVSLGNQCLGSPSQAGCSKEVQYYFVTLRETRVSHWELKLSYWMPIINML